MEWRLPGRSSVPGVCRTSSGGRRKRTERVVNWSRSLAPSRGEPASVLATSGSEVTGRRRPVEESAGAVTTVTAS